jgi:hypothetical protein
MKKAENVEISRQKASAKAETSAEVRISLTKRADVAQQALARRTAR